MKKIKERSLANILVNKPFQLKILTYFLGFFSFASLSSYLCVFLFYWNIKKKGLKLGIPEDHLFFKFLTDQKEIIDQLFGGLVALNFVLLTTLVLMVTHRIATPIEKVKRFLQDPEKNSEFSLREKDFFKELKPLIDKFKGQ